MIAGILNCLARLPNSRGCKTTLWGRDCPSQQKGDWRGRVSFTRAECLNVDRRTSLIMTPKRFPPCLAVPAWSGRTSPVIQCTIPGVGQKDSQSGPERKSLTQEYLETQKSPGPSGTLMALLRMQFGMEGQESTSSTQEAKKTKLASLPAYTPQTTKLKQKPWKQQQLILKPALMLPPMLSSLRTPCPSCRPSSQIGTLNSMTCLLLLPHFVDAMQSPYNGNHRTATCLAMRLLTLWQRRAQQKSKWIDPPATLRWRPSSRPSNTASGGKAPTVQQGWPLLPVNQTGTSYSIQAQDRPQPPQLSPVFQTPHWTYRAVPLRYWQSDNRTSTAVLPHLRATQKGNLARPHSRSPQAVRKPEGPAMHCHLHLGDWSFQLTNKKKKKKEYYVSKLYITCDVRLFVQTVHHVLMWMMCFQTKHHMWYFHFVFKQYIICWCGCYLFKQYIIWVVNVSCWKSWEQILLMLWVQKEHYMLCWCFVAKQCITLAVFAACSNCILHAVLTHCIQRVYYILMLCGQTAHCIRYWCYVLNTTLYADALCPNSVAHGGVGTVCFTFYMSLCIGKQHLCICVLTPCVQAPHNTLVCWHCEFIMVYYSILEGGQHVGWECSTTHWSFHSV